MVVEGDSGIVVIMMEVGIAYTEAVANWKAADRVLDTQKSSVCVVVG